MTTVPAPNCAEVCVNGCVLGDACPHLAYLADARKYIAETSWEQILQTADNYTQGQADPLPSPEELLNRLMRGETPT